MKSEMIFGTIRKKDSGEEVHYKREENFIYRDAGGRVSIEDMIGWVDEH